MDTDDEKKCPDCRHLDIALLQIATDANLAPHKPAAASGPVYTGPTMWHIRRFRWKHCRHVIDYWTDQECYDPKLVYLEEPQDWACDKCAEAHPSTLEWMRKQGKLDIDDPWGFAIEDPTDHPKLRGEVAPRPPSPPSVTRPEASRTPSAPSVTRPPPIAVPRSPPTENRSLYSLTPPAGTTSYYAEDEPAPAAPPAEPAEPAKPKEPTPRPQPPPARSGDTAGYTQPARGGMRRPPPRLNPIAEDLPVAAPIPDEDLSDTDGEGEDPERDKVLGMSSVAPPGFMSRMPTRGGAPSRVPVHEHEVDYEPESDEPLHEELPDWSSAPPTDEAGELTAEEKEEAKKYNFPAGCKVTRRLLDRRREEADLAKQQRLIPEEQVTRSGQGRK